MHSCQPAIFRFLIATTFIVLIMPRMMAQITVRELDPIHLSIEEIGVAQGLSQGQIHGLEVDLKGYLWIATKDGLNRYDGNHFHVFRHDPQDTNTIASNYIRSLEIDDRGLIWVGTNSSGLDLYHPGESKFIHFGKQQNESKAKSSIQSVSKIFTSPSGIVLVWEGSNRSSEFLVPLPGKDPFDQNSWVIKSLEDLYKFPSDVPPLYAEQVLGFQDDGALLFGLNNLLYALYADRVEVLTPLTNPSLQGYMSGEFRYILDNQRRIFCVDVKAKTFYKWNTDAKAFQPWVILPDEFPSNIHRIFFDQQDRIWCSLLIGPTYKIDTRNGTYQRTDISRFHYAGTDATDFGLYAEDQYHNLWAVTSGNGIIKFSSRNDQFSRSFYKPEYYHDNRVVKNGFSFIADDQFTPKKSRVLRDHLEAADLFPITPVAIDQQGRLWKLAQELNAQYVMLQINPEDLSYSSIPIELCLQDMNGAGVSIMFDRNNNLWLGAECDLGEAHLFRYDVLSGRRDSFAFPVKVIRNEHEFIADWYVDPQNVFWLGTKQGIFSFDVATGKWKHYQSDPTDPDAISNNHILSICPDPKSPEKYLWIGTDGGGLNKLEIATGKFIHYTTQNGLPNSVIYAVQSDKHNKLWISTNLGLCRFDPVTEEIWSFTVADGLPGNEYNRMEYSKAADGRLYFGGVEGITTFDPEVFYATSEPSPIVINRLKLSNKDVIYSSVYNPESENDYHLPAPLENLQKLTFPYTERMITLGFSLLDFTNPSGNKYRYKLEGFNTDWIDAGELNEAVFTNLNPGSYTFLVSGRNSNNVWSDPAKLQLIIRSPWWGTWWFRSFVIVLIAGGIYAFYRYRLQQAMKLQHLRNRIAADLHDEIGSTLSSISLAGTVIRHKLKANHPEVDGLLHKINHNTQTMMEAMSDIVWAVNTKNDRFDQVLHRMRAFAVEILEPNDIMVHFDSNPNITSLLLDMQQRKNLYLIFKEVIHNAAKYAQCQNVWVTLAYKQGCLTMEVKDDGIGFDVQSVKESTMIDHDIALQKMGGNGIANMYTRAEELKGKLEVHTSPGNGTRVCLIFSV